MSVVPPVGIVANPASGRDIRRLVAGASVFGNADKASMVLRLLVGLGACGVRTALMMPAADGLGASLERQLRSYSLNGLGENMPGLELVPVRLTGTVEDTFTAVRLMCEAGVAAIVVLGGDGTHRAVAKGCGNVPICALSTGTNNVFPEMREATTAGMATALAITGRGGPDACRQEIALAVDRDGAVADLALVDVALTADRFVGARAVWHPDGLRELVVTIADPTAVGLSSIAGLLAPFERASGRGLHVRFASSPSQARAVLPAPLAPGLVAPVAVSSVRALNLGDAVTVDPGGGVLALDGEREIELAAGERATVRVINGPTRIDVDAVMRHAARDRAMLLQPSAI
jgi:predicted polyphosphate/ATP-dependent NAD kinase